MAGLWQRTGTVTVTSGSKTITGFGTKWKTGVLPIQKGHAFYGPDNWAYEVDTVVSDTELTLVEAYRGGTLASQAYRIDITRTSTISQFSAELSALVGKYRTWFDSMITWLTGSGDVSILNPDTGTTTTIPSWAKVASEGEGQAARAKTEADRAKTEADRALTEAGNAGTAVANAALPFPDVWIPLNDSLRMFAGYGREVKVGEDVIERYVNFDRATTAWYFDKSGMLKQAAINEPRFEKEGLLLEGPSTNLHKFSEFDGTIRADQVAYNLNYTVKTDTRLGMQVARFSRDATIATHTVVNRNVVTSAAAFYCASALVKDDGVGKTELWLRDQQTSTNFSRVALDFQTGVVTLTNGGSFTQCTGGAIKKADGWWLVWASANVPASGTLQNQVYVKNSAAEVGTDAEALLIAYLQMEVGQTPSSYIKTIGASATRSADSCYLPVPGNIPAAEFTATVQVQVDWLGLQPPNSAPRILSIVGGGLGGNIESAVYADARINSFGGVSGGGAISTGFINGAAVTLIKSTVGLNSYCGNNKAVGNQGVTSELGSYIALGQQKSNVTRHLYGHLRNLRIWHFAATDAQIKALR